MNLVLCGMPGAGKTAVGAALAGLCGRKFVDTDALIVQRHGDIAGIFERLGEAGFRALEREIVCELAPQNGLVIATGGGTVADPENCRLLKRNGRICYLRAAPETLLKRISGDGTRPLLAGDPEKNLRKLWETRKEIYERAADFIVDTDAFSVIRVAERIVEEGRL